jgi:aspartate kinase
MKVAKFGGASIQDEKSVLNVVEIIKKYLNTDTVLVFSAAGKTTRRLLAAADMAAEGGIDKALAEINSIYIQHHNIFTNLAANSDDFDFPQRSDDYKNDLEKLMSGIYQLGGHSPAVLDHVLSYGEFFSAALLTDILRSKNIPAARVDARELIITNDDFSRAVPFIELTESKIKQIIPPLLNAGQMPVVEGFIGKTEAGHTTTLGFEGSDFTAAILGSALEAETVQLWKDVPGVMSADPVLCPEARLVNRLTYAEAAVLTSLGAKVLHPKTLEPASKKNIQIHVKSLKNPSAPGTSIYNYKIKNQKPELVSITSKTDLVLIQLTLNSSIYPGQAMREILDFIGRFSLNPYFLAVTQRMISIAEESGRWHASRHYELKRLGSIESRGQTAIVSLVGENIQNNYEIMKKGTTALDGLSVFCAVQGLYSDAVLFGLHQKDCKTALKRLHRIFFGENSND